MAGHEPVDEYHGVGDSLLVQAVRVACSDFGPPAHSGEGGHLSVAIAFTGEPLDSEEVRTQRVLVPAADWLQLNRLVLDALAAQAAGRAELAWFADLDDDDEDDLDDLDDEELQWQDLVEAVAACLEVLEPGQFLILVAPGNRFTQLFVDDDGAQVETVSNQFLAPEHQLGFDVLDTLVEQGWAAPTHFTPGEKATEDASPNHLLDLDGDWDADTAAELLVETLRTVHRVRTPAELSYTAASVEGEVLLLPTLGLPRENP